MSTSNSKRPSREAAISFSSLPEELLEQILEEYICSALTSQVPGSTCTTSPYPSPYTSPSVSPIDSERGSPPAVKFKHLPESPSRTKSLSSLSGATNAPSAHSTTGIPGHAGTYPASVITPLLISRLFHRISAPLLYRLITLSSRSRTQKLLEGSLRHHPERARWIRRLTIAGIWEEGGEVLRIIGFANAGDSVPAAIGVLAGPPGHCGKGKDRRYMPDPSKEWPIVGLEALEVTIDAAPLNLQQVASARSTNGNQAPSSPRDSDSEAMSNGLLVLAQTGGATKLRSLVMRKPQNVYLTHQRAKVIVTALAKVVETAPALERAHIAFRLSDDPVPRTTGPGQESRSDHGPVAILTQALALRPCLRTLTTHLPSVWNEALLRISHNPALERIVLVGAGGRAVTVNGPANSTPVSPRSAPVPTMSRDLPHHPVERVYTTSTRGCDGYAIAAPNRPGNSFAPSPIAPPLIGSGRPPIPGTGIFINEARKHERLCELIHAGYLSETRHSFLPSPVLSQAAFGLVSSRTSADVHGLPSNPPSSYSDTRQRCPIPRGPVTLSSLS